MLVASRAYCVARGLAGSKPAPTQRLRRAPGRAAAVGARRGDSARHCRIGIAREVAARARETASTETTDPSVTRAKSGASASTSSPEDVAPPSTDSLPVARATLLLVPLLWATYNPAMRFIYASDASPSPAELTAVRMLIALVPFSLVLLSVAKDEASRSRKDRRGSSSDGAKKRDVLLLARAGAELGFLNAAGTAFQAFGLERTSATRAGFLLSTINVLVPLGAALTGQKVKPAVFLGVGLACVGVFVSETSGLEPLFSQTVFARGESLAGVSVVAAASASGVVESAVDAFDFGAGDACCLAAAALYSAFTVRLGTYAARLNAAELSAAKALAMTALCVAWWGLERVCLGADAAGSAPASVSILWSCASAAGGFGGASAVAVWGAVAYSALAPGALANVLQTRGQSAVPAAEAQLIFATTPVFNAAVAAAALGETATTNTLVGGAVILAASLMPFLADPDEDE